MRPRGDEIPLHRARRELPFVAVNFIERAPHVRDRIECPHRDIENAVAASSVRRHQN
jgi:hypothetical protein